MLLVNAIIWLSTINVYDRTIIVVRIQVCIELQLDVEDASVAQFATFDEITDVCMYGY